MPGDREAFGAAASAPLLTRAMRLDDSNGSARPKAPLKRTQSRRFANFLAIVILKITVVSTTKCQLAESFPPSIVE
jgi:hypothetical protein